MMKSGEQDKIMLQPKTKLITPCIPPGYLRRPYLVKRFKNAIQHKIVLVIAPAGYGKTTFLCDSLSFCNHPVAWLSLDQKDDYLYGFINNLILSIREIAPSFGKGVVDALQCKGSNIEKLLTEMINEIMAEVPDIIIVLDDYHVIESAAVHDSVAYLMDYLPPQAHIILSTRSYPPLSLNRLRGRGHVAEIRIVDLRFTLQDTTALLENLVEAPLTESTILHVHSRIEGWITGLRMLILAMQGKEDIDPLLSSLSESPQDIIAYLTSEVLDQQEEQTRRFLLESSFFENFSARMCDDVFQHNNSRQMIELISARNLFLQPVDNTGERFRYHSLFRDALFKQMMASSKQDISVLHMKASCWYERELLLEEALEHALEACDYERVLSLLDKIVFITMGQDHYDRFWNWIQRLPEKLVSNNLWVNIGCAVSCEMNRLPEQQKKYLQAAFSIYGQKDIVNSGNSSHETGLFATLYVLKILEAYHTGKISQAIQFGEEGLNAILEDDVMGRCGILCMKGFSHWKDGQLLLAYDCCGEAVSLGKSAQWQYSVCLNLSAVAHIHFARFHLNSAAETCRQIITTSSQEERDISSSCYAHLLLARIFYQRNLMCEAEQSIRQAIRLSENGQEPMLWLSSQMALARIYMIRGDVKNARKIASYAKIAIDEDYPDSQLANMLLARVYLMAGEVFISSDYMKDIIYSKECDLTDTGCLSSVLHHDVYGNDVRNVWSEVPLFTYVRVRLAQKDTEGLSELLNYVRCDLEEKHWKNLLIETLILQALTFEADRDSKSALDTLAESLSMTEKEDYLRVYIDEGYPMQMLLRRARRRGLYPDHVSELLSLFERPCKKSFEVQGGSAEFFTRREREILELLCSGATNQEIAQKLYLSLSTVKNHIQNIYEKMDVGNRTQAVIRSQELGLFNTRHPVCLDGD